LVRTSAAAWSRRPRSTRPEEAWYERALHGYSVAALRVALGVVFIWFGALKVADVSPVGDLVASTLPFLDADLVVPGLGAFEVALVLVLISGRFVRVACAAMVAHLAGTFLVYVVQPDVAFQHGNPLLMTTEGEFVAKNIVLITAGLVVAAASRRRAAR
jgi:putative oxidoreductase